VSQWKASLGTGWDLKHHQGSIAIKNQCNYLRMYFPLSSLMINKVKKFMVHKTLLRKLIISKILSEIGLFTDQPYYGGEALTKNP
jgi:hypothetical protein